MLLETMHYVLGKHGYDDAGCANPGDAIRMIETYRPDLMLLNYLLPEWNGGEFAVR
ncbi:hypothetical protein [Pedobacter sp.]|uniref:hypothetical protein n=1 Tax=Pedobacter sp. TaxID=1411316 RepID=UPI003C71AE75